MNIVMTIRSSFSAHTLDILPSNDAKHPAAAAEYKRRYAVYNAGMNHLFFYMATGYEEAPNEVHIWYPNGQMWSGFGKSMQEAIEGAQEDGWKYATNG